MTLQGQFARARTFCLVATAAALLVPQVARSQEGALDGRITGQVFNAETGAPVPGAQIQIEGLSIGTISGIEGRYQVAGIPAGTVSVRVVMLGYAPKVITGVAVGVGQSVYLDITLERQTLQLEGLVVTAQQEQGSTITLIGQQRLATAVVSAVSREQISRSPDSDAAAAMKRVSGVTVQDGKYVFVRGLGERYTTSSLNGARIPSPDPERKSVPLDLFPSGMLQSVSMTKTFTPDRPGDFSGGAVDIRTPEFPEVRTVSLSVSTGYSPEVTGRGILSAPTEGGEWVAFGASEREMPSVAQGFSGTQTRGDEVNAVINSLRNVWSVQESTGRMPLSVSGSIAGSTEIAYRTIGYLAALTYSNAQEVKLEQRRARYGVDDTELDRFDGEEGTSSVLWGGMANVSLLLGTHTQLHLNNTFSRSGDSTARSEVGVDENTRSRVQIERLTYVERSVRSHQLVGQHQMAERHRIDWSLNTSSVSRSEPDRSEFVTWLDPDVPVWFKDIEGAIRTFGAVDETGHEGSTTYQLDVGTDRVSPTRVKVGLNARMTKREASSVGFLIQPFSWSPTDSRWQGAPEEFLDGRNAQPGDDVLILAPLSSGGSYDAEDRLFAAFGMVEWNMGERVRMIAGARVERYTLDLNSENQLSQDFSTTKEYTDLLPSVTANFQVRDNHQLRLSATRTLARPEYREVAPVIYREVLGGEQIIGEGSLERTLIDNVDARWEWYPTPGEVLSLGVFAKRFDQPIEQRYLAISAGELLSYENAESATNLGVELDVNRKLDWISPSLEPWSVFGNVTLMRSRVKTRIEGDPERAMVGQAPWVVNSGLAYSSDSGVVATALYNVVGPRIANARPAGHQVEDVVEQARHLLDFSLRFPVVGGASAKVDLKNLLDAPNELLQGAVVREYYRSGRSVSVGLSWRH